MVNSPNKAYILFEKQYMSRTKKSKELYEEARQHLAGGVAGNGTYKRPYPLYIKEAKGTKIIDVDGNEYVDLLSGGGPAILGHSPAPVMEAVERQLKRGTVTMVPYENLIELARKITQHMLGMEMLRFSGTGSEAVHMALRVARAYTGRERTAKFEGNYHGQEDNETISGGVFSGTEDWPKPVPYCAGIPKSTLKDTLILPFNNTEATVSLIKKHAKELAAVVVEPVAGTFLGGLPAEKPFVEAVRKVTEEKGILLIFDEVITGFRLGLSGAISISGVVPDLRALGKMIGGGFPVGAYGGRRDIMEKVVTPPLDPSSPEAKQKIWQSGTFSGNPVSVTAGLATIKELEKPGFYERINGYGERIRNGWKKMGADLGLDLQIVGIASIFALFFSSYPIKSIRDTTRCDVDAARAFFLGLLANGVHVPSLHLGFTNGAQTDADIDKVLKVSEYVLSEIKKSI